jgi:hypothetical protein
VAALITERFGVEVETTPSTKTGEITVSVDGARVLKKHLPFIKPGDAKVLKAVEAALA